MTQDSPAQKEFGEITGLSMPVVRNAQIWVVNKAHGFSANRRSPDISQQPAAFENRNPLMQKRLRKAWMFASYKL